MSSIGNSPRNSIAGRCHLVAFAIRLYLLLHHFSFDFFSICVAFRMDAFTRKSWIATSSTYTNNNEGRQQLINGKSNSFISSRRTIAFSTCGVVEEEPISKAPNFNGKIVYPVKVFLAGLKSEHSIPAVYAVLNNEYKRGKDGWENCIYVGTTANLSDSLQTLLKEHGSSQVAHVRALSFVDSQLNIMNGVASKWREMVDSANGNYMTIPTLQSELDFQGITTGSSSLREDEVDEDDDDDFDEDDIDFLDIEEGNYDLADVPSVTSSNGQQINDNKIEEQVSETGAQPSVVNEEEIVSPFDASRTSEEADTQAASTVVTSPGGIEFNKASVDAVLDEVRPYLISDGGNVSVIKVDEAQQDVYLKLEGACGSCASSTVTMKMGIERVLLENFPNLGNVIEVGSVEEESSEEATSELEAAVRTEVKRVLPAISAMGGSADIISVDEMGVVEVQFRGAKRLQKGLELALLDIPKVKHVKFLA